MHNKRDLTPEEERAILAEMAVVFPCEDEGYPTDEEIDEFLDNPTKALIGDLERLPSAVELFSGNLVPFTSESTIQIQSEQSKELRFAMNRKNENNHFDEITEDELERQRKRVFNQEKDDQPES